MPFRPGFHSVIDKPDSVRRVIPPTIVIRKTKAADASRWYAKTLLVVSGTGIAFSDAGGVDVVDSKAGEADDVEYFWKDIGRYNEGLEKTSWLIRVTMKLRCPDAVDANRTGATDTRDIGDRVPKKGIDFP